jgi:hypothetical protein
MVRNTKEYTQEEVVAELQKFCDKFSTRGEAATALGVGRVFLWKVLNGATNPTESILDKLGFKRERVITYKYSKVR